MRLRLNYPNFYIIIYKILGRTNPGEKFFIVHETRLSIVSGKTITYPRISTKKNLEKLEKLLGHPITEKDYNKNIRQFSHPAWFRKL